MHVIIYIISIIIILWISFEKYKLKKYLNHW